MWECYYKSTCGRELTQQDRWRRSSAVQQEKWSLNLGILDLGGATELLGIRQRAWASYPGWTRRGHRLCTSCSDSGCHLSAAEGWVLSSWPKHPLQHQLLCGSSPCSCALCHSPCRPWILSSIYHHSLVTSSNLAILNVVYRIPHLCLQSRALFCASGFYTTIIQHLHLIFPELNSWISVFPCKQFLPWVFL